MEAIVEEMKIKIKESVEVGDAYVAEAWAEALRSLQIALAIEFEIQRKREAKTSS